MTGGRTLHVLSAGAAKAVVLAVTEAFRSDTGVAITATFDAAGAIRARFETGASCDVLIAPAAMLEALAASSRVVAASIVPLGRVATGIAVADRAHAPSIADADALRVSLERATALYCPDTERATAGIHFIRVLRKLGIHERVAPRIRAYANGALAMAALATDASGRGGAIGCTQVTEILYTPGIVLVGPLPPPFELETVYAVAIGGASANPAVAAEFVARLTGRETLRSRESSGFRQ